MRTLTSLLKNRRSLTRVVLTFLLILDAASMPVQAQVGTIGKIKIVIVSGDRATNWINRAIVQEPVVQVQDARGQPVPGATILFLAPQGGAGGVFANGLNTLRVATDEKGMAFAKGFSPNQTPGEFQIRVEASYQGETASAIVTQVNAKKSGSGKTIAIIALIAAAGAGAGLGMAGKKGESSTSPAKVTTTISSGTITIGPPPE